MTSTLPAPRHTAAPATPAGLRRWYAVMGVGGALGMVTAAWQTVERIAWASDPSAPSVCEINAVLSCSSVYSHWQSAALGIPNSLIALPVFAIIAATGLAGVLGSSLTSRFVALVFALTVIMTAFVTWYLEQSALAIGVLCLFCIGCAATILLAGVGITRVADGLGALGSGRLGRGVGAMVATGADLVAWAGLALLLTVMLTLGLLL